MERRAISGGVAFAVALTLLGCGLALVHADDTPIDFERARALHQRVLKGEKLEAADQAYYDRARQAGQQKAGENKTKAETKGQGMNPLAALLPPPRSSTGLVPLTELGSQTYKGEDGGLYGGGSNEPPAEHRAAVEAQLKQIRPLDANGRPADDGKIVMISIGMSNTTMEFSAFKRKADADPRKSPAVQLVDGAQGGRVASVWANNDGGARGPDPWPVLDERLKEARVSPAQVQVAWIKHAQAGPHDPMPFPRMGHAQTLAANTIITLDRLRLRFPNLRVAYLSNRIYAGYATTPLNPEPYAYEGAFAVRWVIQAQIKGDPLLNFDPARGHVMAPAVLWGPYLWADGVKPRQGDNLAWLKEDLTTKDGTHPSDSGREKVANLLLDFVHDNPLARSWYLGQAVSSAN